jgi:hypothetical protein
VLAACVQNSAAGRLAAKALKIRQVLWVFLHAGEHNILGLVQPRRYPCLKNLSCGFCASLWLIFFRMVGAKTPHLMLRYFTVLR